MKAIQSKEQNRRNQISTVRVWQQLLTEDKINLGHAVSKTANQFLLRPAPCGKELPEWIFFWYSRSSSASSCQKEKQIFFVVVAL